MRGNQMCQVCITAGPRAYVWVTGSECMCLMFFSGLLCAFKQQSLHILKCLVDSDSETLDEGISVISLSLCFTGCDSDKDRKKKDIEYEGRAGVMVNNRTHCSCQYLSVYTEKFPSQLCTPFHLLWLCVFFPCSTVTVYYPSDHC